MKMSFFKQNRFIQKGFWKFIWLVIVLVFGLMGSLGSAVSSAAAEGASGGAGSGDASAHQSSIMQYLYMPFVNQDQTFSLSGQIIDQNSNPAAGVVVKANNVVSAVSGADGVYVLTGLKADTYTVTPQNSNRYYFEPASRSVILTGPVTGVNFKAMPSAGEYINNGSFEDNTDWEINSTEILAGYSTRGHHTGLRSMQVGILDSAANLAGFSKFRQTVPLPNSISVAQLTFWMYPNSTESNTKEYQYVYVVDSKTGATLEYLINNQRRNETEWVKYQFDLTKYAGKYVQVVFAVYNDGVGGFTGMLIDDVSVTITP